MEKHSPKVVKSQQAGELPKTLKYQCRTPPFNVRFPKLSLNFFSFNIKKVTVLAPLTAGSAKTVKKLFEIPMQNCVAQIIRKFWIVRVLLLLAALELPKTAKPLMKHGQIGYV